jgi:ATPase subunit of ABC transporter with duplicated ATPase domains
LIVLSKAAEDSNPMSPVTALRKIKHAQLLRDFQEVEKMARYRSGARGYDARKVLIAYEKKVEDSTAILNQRPEDVSTEEIEEETKAAVDMLADLQFQLENMKIEDVNEKARRTLLGLGFKEAQLEKPFSSLSGGWKMRCLLAGALIQTSDVLILDEPTNFLDLLGILWLQRYLEDMSENSPLTTVLLVSHDRDFINATTSETIIIRDQTLTYFNGNLAAYDKSIRHEIIRMTRMKEAQEKQVAHMEKTVINNMRVGKKTGDENRIRQAKSRQKKLEERTGLMVSAKGTRFKLNRDRGGYFADGMRNKIEVPKLELDVALQFPPTTELKFPGALISLDKVDYKYPKAPKPTLTDINLVIHMGDKVGILGLNGAGKSTLIKLLVDELQPGKGTATRHPRLKIGYFSQDAVDNLKALGVSDPSLSALSFIQRCASDAGEALTEQLARGFLSGLGLAGRTASDVPLSKLSGGQLVRVELAHVLLTHPQLLVLDEPTTHLDLPTVHALMEALAAFEGAVVLVSHDRALIRCVVEGDPIYERDSGEESDGESRNSDHDADDAAAGVGRFVYELKAGKLAEKAGGVAAWEAGLERRLKKLGL